MKTNPIHLVLFQPDIAPNTGALIRLCACMATPLHLIEPCGFPLDDRRMRRAALDYYDLAEIVRHRSWDAFEDARGAADRRLVLLTTRGETSYADFAFAPGDMLMLGRESAGAPNEVHRAADARLHIPLAAGTRSLNLAIAAAMALGEALRQIRSDRSRSVA